MSAKMLLKGGIRLPHDEFAADYERLYAEIARRARARFEPNADVWLSADATAVYVAVEIAGADPAELSVAFEDGFLQITGRRLDRERPRDGSVLMKEIEYGEFRKRIHVPVAIDQEHATAAYHDGMLTIQLPVAKQEPLTAHGAELRMIVRRIPA